ncbi:kinase-like domain-containing protein [Crassisporium funariophilum]|nr:kinase-like domain-containing protein [Crassisporium funariophilum]
MLRLNGGNPPHKIAMPEMTVTQDVPEYTQYPDMELVSYYCKGGYHPIHINDIFHQRYRIVNKLGYGAYATVWLVEDLMSKRYASLKVLAADASKAGSEIEVLRHLRGHQQRTSEVGGGGEYVMKVFDDFVIEGPNGTHRGIVTELLGPSLASDIEEIYEDERYPIPVGIKMAAQIARGVAYLHKCGIVHGDLHMKNMLLCTPQMSHWSQQQMLQYFGEPRKRLLTRRDREPTTTSPHVPAYLVTSPDAADLLKVCLTPTPTNDIPHIKICDFGEAFLWKGTPRSRNLNTPRVYAAPEVIFHSPISPATDVWALAVLMHMILSGGMSLFSSYRGDEDEVVREMVLILGKLPEPWWRQWKGRKEWFDGNGIFTGDRTKLPPVSGKLVKVFGMGEEDRKAFERLVKKMVCYEMKDRISADEVVRLIPATWMRNA